MRAKKNHGLSTHPLHAVWRVMIDRCHNPNNIAYDNYGGRGIIVTDRWHTFLNFFADVSSTYRPGLTLDRKDNDGDYSPDNCQWATMTTQARNRRGMKLTAALAAEIRATCTSSRKVAAAYGVSQTMVLEIRRNKKWIGA